MAHSKVSGISAQYLWSQEPGRWSRFGNCSNGLGQNWGRLQKSIRERLESLDVKIDENLRTELMKTMKPEGRTVESLRPHVASILSEMSGF